LEKTQVVVAGAGPVGAVAATILAQRGIEVVICETGLDCAQDLRASTFHPPTLEMLDEIGVADDIIRQGLKAPVYHWRERETGAILDFDFSEIADRTRYPFRIQCEQFYLARKLANRLADHPNADPRFNHRLVWFDQNETGVTVAMETPIEIKHVRADYLIGADGANSIVRKWLGVGFEGFTYPEKFLCLSTETPIEDYLPNLAYVNYVSDPREWLVLLRVPSVWRVLVPASEHQDDAFLLSDTKKDEVFGSLLGNGTVQTRHRTIYRVHQRVAEKFNHGRVFLIGDSAHLNNPLGGFGMNSGIHDAWNLCTKLAAVYDGEGGPELFDLFDRQRRAITHSFVQTQTKQNMELMKVSPEASQQRLKERMQRLHRNAEDRREYLLYQSMIKSLDDERAIQ
jgi:3-(3-hydroxy-phenyl)propionate hydroxylase